MTAIQNVPTTIITGFLGVGKTTAILHLLKTKPTNERWAVLVNEFGEIGIDGSLIGGKHAQSKGLYITEVPGGCMCCASGVPMQIALNTLLKKAKPDRLLIEPTGLGHPKEVLKVLSAEHYHGVLQLNATITLVDARTISDPRYTDHDTFNQQLEIADIVVGNKTDLSHQGDKQKLTDYLQNNEKLANKPLFFISNGELDAQWLGLPNNQGAIRTQTLQHDHQHGHKSFDTMASINSQPIPPNGFLQVANSGEGFQSLGWRFCGKLRFDRQKIVAVLADIQAVRVKAVLITTQGIFGYNKTSDGLTEVALENSLGSRIEIIATQCNAQSQEQWQAAILSCTI